MTIKEIKVNSDVKLTHAAAVRDYVVSVIEHDGSAFDKLKFFFETFNSEYGYNVRRVGLQNAVRDYLQGLPSTINHEFENHKIIPLLIQWGYLKESDTEANTYAKLSKVDEELENYWKYLAMALVVMGRRNKIIN